MLVVEITAFRGQNLRENTPSHYASAWCSCRPTFALDGWEGGRHKDMGTIRPLGDEGHVDGERVEKELGEFDETSVNIVSMTSAGVAVRLSVKGLPGSVRQGGRRARGATVAAERFLGRA